MRTLIVTGRLGADAEIRTSQKSGLNYIQFSMGNNEASEKDGKTYWFTVRGYNTNLLNIAKYLKKGHAVSVMGRLETSGYVSNKTNQIEVSHTILADSIQFDNNYNGRQKDDENGIQENASKKSAAYAGNPTARRMPIVNTKKTVVQTVPAETSHIADAAQENADDLPF